MKWSIFVIFVAFLSLAVGQSDSSTKMTTASISIVNPTNFSNEENSSMATFNSTHLGSTGRHGRQLQIDRIELPFSGTDVKRHIIKIPPNVSRVKVIHSNPAPRPRKLIYSRIPNRIPLHYYQSQDKSYWKNFHESSDVGADYYEYNETDSDSFSSTSGNSNELRRSYSHKRFEDVHGDEERFGLGHYFPEDEVPKYKKHRSAQLGMKAKRKIPGEGSDHGGGRFSQNEDIKIRYRSGKRDESGYYEYEPIEPPRYLKQFPFGLKVTYPSGIVKHEKQIYGNYVAPLTVKKLPPSKGKKSFINPQYTTHNSQVATNFGLTDFVGSNSYGYPQRVPFEASPSSEYEGKGIDKFSNPVESASENSVNTLTALTPGIKVIQPPQFGDTNGNHPKNSYRSGTSATVSSQQRQQSESSQKATIRDILEQDCPGYEIIGFCESPPRYPMHQIGIIVKKCANLMEVMKTQNLFRQEDINAFSERSDIEVDNITLSSEDFDSEKHGIQKRAESMGIQACRSELSIIEPGYAREETSGRWFVIVQHSESTQQRIMADTCKNPGKPCAGLSDLKCIRAYAGGGGSGSGKFTKCLQKYTYQKLISWDPDAPDSCPRLRTFKFPSACVCHVGVA